jgi:hypothetical protein
MGSMLLWVPEKEALVNGIIGTWRLVGETAVGSDGKPRPTLFGPSLLGVWTFDASGRNALVAVDGRLDLAEGKRMFLSYSGLFEFDGARLTTFVDATSDPSILHVPQVRDVRFEGDTMILSPPVGYRGQADVHRELKWQRIA